MDRITKSILTSFCGQFELEALREDQQFEHFLGYLATSKHYSDSFNLDDIAVGGGGDSGFDTITILVNGCLVTESEEIEDLAETNGFLDVTFIFCQAERSGNFDSSKIGQLGFGVKDFLSENPKLVQNEQVKRAASISNAIFEQSKLFKKGNPECYLYYGTTGSWQDDANLVARRDQESKDIRELTLFRQVEFRCVGREWLQEAYRDIQKAISAEIVFADKVTLPDLKGVEQAYVGLISATEFLKLILDENGRVRDSVFYDNVRHFQGWNDVNKGIKETISSPERCDYFPLFNNGITVVAKKLNQTANKMSLEDYQIVNGCQTSFVLSECKDILSASMKIPLRLVSTEDENIRTAITRATNQQTEVREDQLIALSEFPKKLEHLFQTFEGKKCLFYERRSRQYGQNEDVTKVRIVTMATLLRSFASIFQGAPHRTTRSYRALLKDVGNEIFGKDHQLEPYYLSAYANYRIESLFRANSIDAKLKPARYHMLLAARLHYSKDLLPRMNSREMIGFCERFLDVLWDDDKSRSLFEMSATLVTTLANGDLQRDKIRVESFTEALLTHFGLSSKNIGPRK